MIKSFAQVVLYLAILVVGMPGSGQEVTESGQKLEIKVETVLTDLYNPCGVTVRPGTSGEKAEIFVSDSGGLRIIRMIAGEPNKSVDVITGFPKSTYGETPAYDIGPLGISFLDNSTLIVGGGGLANGAELLRVYKLPDELADGGSTLVADQMDHSVGPIAAGDDSKGGEGNFYAVAVNKESTAVYVGSNGDHEKGWVLKATAKKGRLESLGPFIQTKVATGVDGPVGLAVSPKNWLVVGQLGQIGDARDSLLAFYKPADGVMALKLETGLFDLSALVYSPAKDPSDSRLYALDFAWTTPAEGGLFRLQATNTEKRSAGCFANKLVALDRPTAMAFTPDGTLYVTVFGTPVEGSEAKPGRLLKITGKFSVPVGEDKK